MMSFQLPLFDNFSTHIQRKRIATIFPTSARCSLYLFNPYPAKADCDVSPLALYKRYFGFSTHIQRKRIATGNKYNVVAQNPLFNPYPAKADCDSAIEPKPKPKTTFQPISSESGLRPYLPLCHVVPRYNFSTHIQRKRIATNQFRKCGESHFAFQPISSESGLRPAST